jgi:hypothetical protein
MQGCQCLLWAALQVLIEEEVRLLAAAGWELEKAGVGLARGVLLFTGFPWPFRTPSHTFPLFIVSHFPSLPFGVSHSPLTQYTNAHKQTFLRRSACLSFCL